MMSVSSKSADANIVMTTSILQAATALESTTTGFASAKVLVDGYQVPPDFTK
jgi:hypothetical protein